MGDSGSEEPTRGDHQVPVVLLMKGNPAMSQCGFSRAAVQILELHGVLPEKPKLFDVILEDPTSLRTCVKEFSYVPLPPVPRVSSLQCSEWPAIPQIYVNGSFLADATFF